MDEVNKLENEYLKTSSPALSPIIKANLKAIRNYRNGDSKALDGFIPKGTDIDIYLEELAKVNIFITEKVKCPNDITREILIESAFASYQYQKLNNLPFAEFDDFFNDTKGHPFDNFKKVAFEEEKSRVSYIFNDIKSFHFGDSLVHLSSLFDKNKELRCYPHIGKDIDGKSFDLGKGIYLNNTMSKEEYTLSLMKTLTHELQHKVSHNGVYEHLYDNFPEFVRNLVSLGVSGDISYLNEICTEWNAQKIISLFLDENKLQVDKDTFTNNENKECFFDTNSKDYKEGTQFFDALNIILDGNFNESYYNRNIDFKNNTNEKIKKFESLIYAFCDSCNKLYVGGVYSESKLLKENFDAMINSFTDLAESYIRNEIGINKNTDFTSPNEEIKLKELSKFFNSFESITFIIDGKTKDGKELYEREIIKSNILDSIFEKNEAKIQEVKNLLDGKAKTASATAVTTSTSAKVVSSSVSVTTVNDVLSFVPSFSEIKLKENSKEFDVNCSLSQLKQIFENYVKDNGFEKDRDGKYYKEDASVDDVKKLINHFFETRELFKGCIETVTIKDKDNTYQINDFSSVNNLDINIKQKSKELNVSEDLEL